MRIVDIFAVVEGSLYTVRYDGKAYDEFKNLFKQWQDIEYLEQFFEDNKHDLENGIYKHLSIVDAISRTTKEALKFERKILQAANNSTNNPNAKITLENVVFTSLHKEIRSNEFIETKAYGTHRKSWLRVYAIRLAQDVYFVSGGAIKLTKDMKPPHLKEELKKLKVTTAYLKEQFVFEEEDLGYIELGNYGEE